jgi:hypothetical protein
VGTLPYSFHVASIMVRHKLDTTRKENYRLISVMKIDAEILNQILTNQFNNILRKQYTTIT